MKRWGKLMVVGFLILALFLIWSIYWGLTPKNVFLVFSPREVTPVSPLYYIKISREYLQERFVFGDEDLCMWNFTLAKKRLEESQVLFKNNLTKAAQNQAQIGNFYQEKGNYYLNKLIDKIDTNYLIKLRDDNQKLLET